MKIETKGLIGGVALVLKDIGSNFKIKDDAMIKKVTLIADDRDMTLLKVESHRSVNGKNVITIDSREFFIDRIQIEGQK